jgi:hypothetical protein
LTVAEFRNSLSQPHPPSQLHPLLQALWYDGKGDWEKSHNIAQDIHTKDGSWIHAYLHRKEGDNGNAVYWYSRAGRTMPGVSLDEEWEAIVAALLTQ